MATTANVTLRSALLNSLWHCKNVILTLALLNLLWHCEAHNGTAKLTEFC